MSQRDSHRKMAFPHVYRQDLISLPLEMIPYREEIDEWNQDCGLSHLWDISHLVCTLCLGIVSHIFCLLTQLIHLHHLSLSL